MKNRIHAISHGAFRAPWLTISVTALTVFLYAFGQRCFDALIFQRTEIANGQIWRLLSGHFVHCSFDHLIWDLAALLIIGIVIESRSRKKFICSLLVSCTCVSAWVWFVQPQVKAYCGLSGALNGLLIVCAIILYKSSRSLIYPLVIAATTGKIIFELLTHQTLFTSLSAQMIPGAHLAGLAGGVFYLLFQKIYKSQEGLSL